MELATNSRHPTISLFPNYFIFFLKASVPPLSLQAAPYYHESELQALSLHFSLPPKQVLVKPRMPVAVFSEELLEKWLYSNRRLLQTLKRRKGEREAYTSFGTCMSNAVSNPGSLIHRKSPYYCRGQARHVQNISKGRNVCVSYNFFFWEGGRKL